MKNSPPRRLRQLGIFAVLTFLPLSAGVLFGLGTGIGQGSNKDESKVFSFPDAGLSDEERLARIAELRERNAEWTRQFVEKGMDPKNLAIDNLDTYSAGAASISEARTQSQFVIEGEVVSTTYVPEPGNLTTSIAIVKVVRTARGSIGTSEIEVLQVGGPEWTEDGRGVLQQLSGDPLLLPGDRVVLLMIPARSEDQRALNRFQTVYRAGVYLLTASGVEAPHSNAFRATVHGLSADEVMSLFK
jgi:hypothetical protein